MLVKPAHPRNYMSKFNVRWESESFLSVIRQDLNYVDPDVKATEWTLNKLIASSPRSARWTAIWWLLTENCPVPNWVWQDAAWILFKGDKVLANPVSIYAFFDFVESRLEPDRSNKLSITPRIPSISQTTLAHEISLISAAIIGADQGKPVIQWGAGKYELREMF